MKIRTYIIVIVVMSCLISSSSLWKLALQEDVGKQMIIPQEAIRLRILANSDELEDQWLKRKVRDRIIHEIKRWEQKPKSVAEARQLIKQKLPVFQRISEQTIAAYGYHYPVKVDFGKVSFPTKLYGDQVYPAGKYEALRITIGKGEGGNWWCVLFPPLCFIDMNNGDAVAETSVRSASLSPQKQPTIHTKKKKIQVRFFLLEKGLKVFQQGL